MHRLMTWLLQPLDLHIIHMTEPLSAKCTVNSFVNLLVTRVPISIETSNGIVHSHIEIALFISMILTIFVFPFFINRNDYRIVGYWLGTVCVLVLHEIIYNAAKNKHIYKNYSCQIVPQITFWCLKHTHTK